MRYQDLKPEYADLWERSSVTNKFAKASMATAHKIHANKARYQEIEHKTGVPWWWVGIVHAMESGCRFSTHLHNGDPLTARTRLVPAGRPRAGSAPFAWEFSACDALEMKDLHQVQDWSVTRCLYEWERYNGWGYRKYHPGTLSPYLWSGTPHYRAGKYIADGKWSASAISGQTGAAAILLRLVELDGEIAIYHSVKPDTTPAIEEITPDAYVAADEPVVPKKTIAATAGAAAAVAAGEAAKTVPPSVWDSGLTIMGQMGQFVSASWQTVAAIGGVTIAFLLAGSLGGKK